MREGSLFPLLPPTAGGRRHGLARSPRGVRPHLAWLSRATVVLCVMVGPVGLLGAVHADTVGLYNPAGGNFYLRNSNSPGAADLMFRYGPTSSSWLPVVGDWDGDAVVTIGLYHQSPGNFYLRNSNSAGAADLTFRYGPAASGWLPVAGDWNGDTTVTIGLYSQATGTFYLRNSDSVGPADLTFRFGPAASNWLPIAGDWNGDGTVTIGLYNPATSTFYLRNANAGGPADLTFRFGPAPNSWLPIAGDWDRDGDDTVGLYSPTAGTFYLRNANAAGAADVMFRYGPAPSTWKPIAGDWVHYYDITDYWPLAQEDVWGYEGSSSTHGAFEQVRTVSGTTSIGGREYANVVSDVSWGETWMDFLQTAADGVRHAGSFEEGASPELVTFDPPMLMPNDLPLGRTVSESSTEWDDSVLQGPRTFTTTLTGIETVVVPAGTFPDCLRVELSVATPGVPGTDEITLWLAKGVGPVRQYDVNGSFTEEIELTGAIIGGVQYPRAYPHVETKYSESGSYQLRIRAHAAPGDVSSVAISGPSYLATATVNKPSGAGSDDPTHLYDDGLHWDGAAGDGYWEVVLDLNATPQVGDTITFDISFVDASSDSKDASISAVYAQTATLVSPADGATVGSLTPTFQWSDAPSSAITHYQVQIDDPGHNRVFDSPMIAAGTGSYAIPPGHLQSAHTYYWLVSGTDWYGNEVLTNWDTFHTP